MPNVVTVTPAQVNAAKLKIKRSTASGKVVESSVSRIANAKRATTPTPPAGRSNQAK